MPFALDLDGVIWLAEDPIPGSAEAVARLRAVVALVEPGERVLVCSGPGDGRLPPCAVPRGGRPMRLLC